MDESLRRQPAEGRWSPSDRQIVLATWAFVGLGILLRVVRYLMDFPLWGDEAFVAVNFIASGYRELLRPLLYGQACPVLFLWVERSAVLLLGYNLAALRLFPLLCGVASLILFRHVAGRVIRGLPWLLSVGILAVSVHPIRHAVEVKPYAGDLLASLLLLAPAVEWWREKRVGSLWVLAAMVPVALGLSLPAVFVAGGVGLAMLLPVLRTRSRPAYLAFASFGATLIATFLVLHMAVAAAQCQGAMDGLQNYWAGSFPPLQSPGALAAWVVSIHTGTMFAYPGGGKNGASTLTFLLFLAGVLVLWRRREKALLAMFLGPFALTIVAAVLRRYPYGGEARQMQFVAPMICLLMALGLSALVRRIPHPRQRYRAAWVLVLLLVGLGAGSLVRGVRRPYLYEYDRQAREFAQRFWSEQASQAELVCFRWDYSILEHRALNLRTALFLCNEFLYSPHRRPPRDVDWQSLSESHPLRCVLYFETRPDHPDVLASIARLRSFLEFRGAKKIEIAMSGATGGPKQEYVLLFDFVPKVDPVTGRSSPPDLARTLGRTGREASLKASSAIRR